MKLSELMAGYTPDEEYAGITNTDDFVLAIDIADTPSTKKRRIHCRRNRCDSGRCAAESGDRR